MKTLKTTQEYQEQVENTKGLKAVVFTEFNYKCSRCEVAKNTLIHVQNPAIPIFEFSAPLDAYPLPKLELKTVPTLIIFKDNEEVSRLSGYDEQTIPKHYREAIHNNY